MSGGFRIKNMKFLITYPHGGYTDENKLLDKFFTIRDQRDINYAIACVEHHEDGSIHNHIYVEFKFVVESRNPRIFDLEGHHPNIRKIVKTPWVTVDYCKKEGTWVEFHPENAPRRRFETMTTTEKNKFLRENDPINLFEQDQISAEQCARILKARSIIELYRPTETKREKPVVLWFYGPTGSGKTRTAVEIARESGLRYWVSSDSDLKWFDGYTGQEYAIIDEFRRQGIKFSWILKLLDRYPLLVPIKGSWVRWSPKVIILTCPVPPREAYQWLDKDGETQDWDGIDQLKRRIDAEIEFFKED